MRSASFFAASAWVFLFEAKAQTRAEFWDMPPIRYSDTVAGDRLTKLMGKLDRGELETKATNGLERLEFVLEYLDVPSESQVLVFSKTSLQNRLIGPKNPRCLFFSENSYVGYVPGGSIEVITHDAILGPVFYLIDQKPDGSMRIERDSSQCLSCHGTSRTENVPGMLIRSVFPSEDGHPLLQFGTEDVDHRTSIEKRWGGWYVTGKSALPHLGNRIFDEDGDLDPSSDPLEDVASLFNTSAYPHATSDIVSLLVLEHQVRAHTLLNAASMNYRRSLHFLKVLDPKAEIEGSSTGRLADSWADDIVGCLFFKGEADLGDGVEGDPAFQREFVKRFPKSSEGDSLAEFRLYGRIFKNRCSYMVYSDAFKGLPPGLKARVLEKMRKVVSGEADGYDWLKESELRRIGKILEETLPGWG